VPLRSKNLARNRCWALKNKKESDEERPGKEAGLRAALKDKSANFAHEITKGLNKQASLASCKGKYISVSK